MTALLSLAVFGAALAAPGTQAAQAPRAVPVEGRPFAAELQAAGGGKLVFQAGGKPIELEAAGLVRWGALREPRRGPVTVLADGGLLVGAVLGGDAQGLRIEPDLLTPEGGGALSLPTARVAGLVFRLPLDPCQRDRLLDRLTEGVAEGGARLILVNGDEVAGRLRGIQEDAVALDSELGEVRVELHRARALLLGPRAQDAAARGGLRAWAGLRDGSRLLVEDLGLGDDSLRLALAGGLKLSAQPRDLVFLQPLGGRATYLSDLDPAASRFVPFFNLPWPPYRKDRSVAGSRLRAGGRIYLKGLGVHSASQVTYELDGSYARFDGELAIDDSARGRGSVRFRVYLDGEPKFTSPPVRGGDPPVPVSIDLAGAKRMELIVVFGERADEMDRADWLDARVVKAEANP